MISHVWFASGAYRLLGHVHQPQGSSAGLGVVIVPPFGWEDVCSYRPLRELAEQLATQGISVLRYDLPATGDSTGNPTDEGLLEAWIASVSDAAAELRAATGVQTISIFGIRMGALLALAAASRQARVGDLVLWGGAVLGRSVLRELRAFRNMEVPEFGEASPTPPNDDSGIESGGFYLAPGTVAALDALNLAALPPMPGRRVLLMTRDEFAVDKKLVAALQGCGAVFDELPGQGYADMMAVPHEARLNAGLGPALAQWLLRGQRGLPLPSSELAPQGAGEEIALFPNPTGTSFGIITPTARHSDFWLLFLNPGAGRHIGPNRLWVDLAREWAAKGIPSLRLDLAGIGESDGAQNLDVAGLYNESLVAQVDAAMECLRKNFQASQFAVVGLCSGAFWAFHSAASNAAVRGAILLNPRLFFWDPEVDRRRSKQRNVNAVASADAWKRLVRGQVPATRIRSAVRDVLGRIAGNETAASEPTQIPAEAFRRALSRIQSHNAQVSMIFTEGEPLLQELEEEGHLPKLAGAQRTFRCIRIAGAGHTFRPLKAQHQLRAALDGELTAMLATARRKD